MTREKKRERKREREEQKPLPSLDLDALRPQSLCSFPTFHLPSFRPTRAFSSRSEGYRVILLNSNPVSSEDEEKEKPFFRERERESERERRERERERSERRARLSIAKNSSKFSNKKRETESQATIMTDPGTADRTYIGPMTPELVEEIIANERPDAVLPTMGGEGGSFFRNSEILNLMGFLGGGAFSFPLSRVVSSSAATPPHLFSLIHGLARYHETKKNRPNGAQPRQGALRVRHPRQVSPVVLFFNFSWIFFPPSFLGSFAPVLWPSSLVFSPDSSLVG